MTVTTERQAHNLKNGEVRALPVPNAFVLSKVKWKVAKTADLAAFVNGLNADDVVSWDLETTGFDPHSCKVTLIGVTKNGNDILVIKPADVDRGALDKFMRDLAKHECRKVGHNAKFDIKWCEHHYGCKFVNVDCTYVMRRMLVAGLELELSDLATCSLEYLGFAHSKEVREQFKGNEVITEEMIRYNAIDVAVTWHLFPILDAYIDVEDLRPVYEHMERKLVPIIARMELAGIGVDIEYLKKFEEMLRGKTKAFQDQLDASLITLNCMPKIERALRRRDATPEQIEQGITHVIAWADSLNINSPKQVVTVLNSLGFPTKSAAKQILEDPPFSPESLAEAAERWGRPELDHSTVRLVGLDVIENIQQLRSGSKALSSFVVPLQGTYINPVTGRVHTNFNQLGTSTGRFSSNEPNVQQMPNPGREEAKGSIFEGMNIRRAFLPPPGYELIVYDYDAMELRILAEITGDEGLIASTLAEDLHCANATIMYGRPITRKDIERDIAKTIIYTIVYGGGPKRVSHLLRCSIERAKEVIELLYDAFPKMAKWIAARKRMAVSYGYSISMSGRKRYYDVPGFRNQWGRPYSKDERRAIIASIERKGQNMPIQATSADIVKLAMVWVDEAISPHGGKLLLQIHDELVAIAPEGEAAERCYELMGAKMIEAEQEFLEVVESKVKGHKGKSWEH